MQQKINLLDALPETVILKLPARTIWLTCLIFFILLMLYYAYGFLGISRVSSDINIHRSLEQTVASQLVFLNEKYPDIANKKEDKEVQSLAKAVKAKQDVIAIIERKKVDFNIRGFSSYLNAFANDILPQVWLTQFDITDGGAEIELDGKSYSKDQLFEFIENLKQDPVFSGLNFKLEEFKKPIHEKEAFDFSIVATREVQQ